MRKLLLIVLALTGVSALHAQEPPAAAEVGFGEGAMRIRPRVERIHQKVLGTLSLTDKEKKAVAEVDKQWWIDSEQALKPYWTTPWSQLTEKDKEAIRENGLKLDAAYQASLKKAMGDKKYALYDERIQVERVREGHEKAVAEARAGQKVEDQIHDRVIKTVGLSPEKLKQVADIEKKYRSERAASMKKFEKLFPIPRNNEARRKFREEENKASNSRLKQLRDVMGIELFRKYDHLFMIERTAESQRKNKKTEDKLGS